MKITITWYGRCCFLVEGMGKKILLDPYDGYCCVDIGRIKADILISSSTWHDHGHIGASPQAWVYTYPGTYNHAGIEITGIEALEDRGSPTVIFNIKLGEFSITNFADFGPAQEEVFELTVTDQERAVLRSTNIAFVRPMIQEEEVRETNTHTENFFEYCRPAIIIPEHYFPDTFIDQHVPDSEKTHFKTPNVLVDEMVSSLGYLEMEVNSHSIEINPHDLSEAKIIKFLHLHPQVTYTEQ